MERYIIKKKTYFQRTLQLKIKELWMAAEEVTGQGRPSSWLSTQFIFRMPVRHGEEGNTTLMAFTSQWHKHAVTSEEQKLTYSLISSLRRNLISHFHEYFDSTFKMHIRFLLHKTIFYVDLKSTAAGLPDCHCGSVWTWVELSSPRAQVFVFMR